MKLKERLKRIDWTDEMDFIIIESMKDTGSVGGGLRQASDILKTSFYNCRNRWYSSLKRKYAHILFNEVQDEPRFVEIKDLDAKLSSLTIDEPEESTNTPDKSAEDFIQSNVDEIIGWLASIKFEKKLMQEEIDFYKQELINVQAENAKLKEDNISILKVINQARMQFITEEVGEEVSPAKFRMERNGNLVVVEA